MDKDAGRFDAGPWKQSRMVAPRMAFEASSELAAAAWRATARRRLAELLTIEPGPTGPPQSIIFESVQCDGYSRESVAFETYPGLQAFAYFVRPDGVSGPLPTLICCPGHGYGVNALVGLDAEGRPRCEADYHANFALQAARQGYGVLAIEILGFGCRCEGVARSKMGATSCGTMAGTALMLGETIAGWRVGEAMRAIDYLQSRGDVDASHIGIMGISGGGLVALFCAALDERIRAAVVSGYLNTFRDSVMSLDHCIDNFVPGLATELEMSDIAGLVAPRALWCESGTEDPIFPLSAFEKAVDAVQQVYRVSAAGARFGSEVFVGGHRFYGEGAWSFLREQL
jgi:dienelactone hydrolase